MTEPTHSHKIAVVDDDLGVLKALALVLRDDGWVVEAFLSAEAFLATPDHNSVACIVLDITMPGLDGLELQRCLRSTGRSVPIVFVTGHGDIPLSVRAIKAGATDFLTKPVPAKALLAAVRSAVDQDASSRQVSEKIVDLTERLASLTLREREVLMRLAEGRLNKQIAGELGIVEQTVKFHRAHIMERMQAKTVAELMHMTAQLGVTRNPSLLSGTGRTTATRES